MFDIHCEMITTIKLINISITSHSYLSVCEIRTFMIYSPSKFQVNNIIINLGHHALH